MLEERPSSRHPEESRSTSNRYSCPAQVLATEEARELVKAYTLLVGQLADFENQHIEAWGASIQASIEAKLKNPLLVREADRLLRVNFDPLIVRLLREVKYFLLLGLRVPESALEVGRIIPTTLTLTHPRTQNDNKNWLDLRNGFALRAYFSFHDMMPTSPRNYGSPRALSSLNINM